MWIEKKGESQYVKEKTETFFSLCVWQLKLNLELMANNIIIREKKSEKQKIKNTRKMCVGTGAQKSVFKVRYTFYVQVSLIIYKKGVLC